MQKVVLITGATDGIGLETARVLVAGGHRVLLHGRSEEKLAHVMQELSGGNVEGYIADLSHFNDVEVLAKDISEKHDTLDVLINNAGVFKAAETIMSDGLDVRFVVNTISPYLLTRLLLPLMGVEGRVVNLSSAAQASVDLDALRGGKSLQDSVAYAQSKLAITMWSRHMALELKEDGPIVVSVNPASLLGSKMVKEAYGITGGDIRIGADILVRAALSDEFAGATGMYYDNDAKCFASPHADALDDQKCGELVQVIQEILSDLT